MQAVIMAAGVGSRFGIYTEDRPKGFIEVGGKSMIERSIDNLIDCGISDILIGTGYMREKYDTLVEDYANKHKGLRIATCFSPRYAETNSMYTLYNMRHLIDGDYLLLESDLIYERRAITALLEDEHPDIMLTSPVIKFQDQYYVEYDRNHWLRNCSTDKKAVVTDSELVGIHKISHDFSSILMNEYSKMEGSHPKLGYEYGLLHIAQHKRKMYVLNIPGLLWYEIDDVKDKEYAEKLLRVNPIT